MSASRQQKDCAGNCCPSKQLFKKDIATNHSKMLRYLEDMRESAQTDCVIIIEPCPGSSQPEEFVLVHKMLIGAYSNEYNEKIKNSDCKEEFEIRLRNTTKEAVDAIVEYLYRDELVLEFRTVGPIWNAACQLDLHIVLRHCIKFLRCISTDNVLIIMCLTEKLRLREIFNEAYQFLCCNFLDVTQTNEFMKYPCHRLKELLCDDNLVIESEVDIYHAIVAWVGYKQDERMQHASELMATVRLWYVPPEAIATEIECNGYKWFWSDPCVKDAIGEAYRFQALRACNADLRHYYNMETLKPERNCFTNPPNAGVEGEEDGADVYCNP